MLVHELHLYQNILFKQYKTMSIYMSILQNQLHHIYSKLNPKPIFEKSFLKYVFTSTSFHIFCTVKSYACAFNLTVNNPNHELRLDNYTVNWNNSLCFFNLYGQRFIPYFFNKPQEPNQGVV